LALVAYFWLSSLAGRSRPIAGQKFFLKLLAFLFSVSKFDKILIWLAKEKYEENFTIWLILALVAVLLVSWSARPGKGAALC